jgi:iron(III) transport system substrate-binding protein
MATLFIARRRRARSFLLACVASLAGGGALAQQIESQPLDEVIAAAKKEGRVVWYESVEPDAAKALMAAFEAKYAPIKITYVEVGGSARVARVTQESRAGGPTADMTTGSVTNVMNLAERDLLRAIDWKALGADPALAPNNYMLETAATVHVTLINTNKIAKADAPVTYDDYVDKKWKGQVGAWVNPSGLRTISISWGENGALDYGKKLAANDLRLFQNPQSLSEAVGAGERAIGLFIPYHTARPTVLRGAPVELTWPEPVPISSVYGYVPKAGKNPNAGKLLLLWLASTEGGQLLEKVTGRGSPSVAGTEMSRLVAGKKIAHMDGKAELEAQVWLPSLEKKLDAVFQGR